MEVSFTPESLEAYNESQELADQRTFVSLLDRCYQQDPDSDVAAEVTCAIEDMIELRSKVARGELELSEDNTPFEKLRYSTFRLERRFFADPENNLTECAVCSLDPSGSLCAAAACNRFERNGVPMGVFFAIIPIHAATTTSGKKCYVPDTPESFDFSPENWNSVKAFIGM